MEITITQLWVAFCSFAVVTFGLVIQNGKLSSRLKQFEKDESSIRGEGKELEKQHQAALDKLNNQHKEELAALNKEIAEFKHRETLRNSNEPNSFEPDWEQ